MNNIFVFFIDRLIELIEVLDGLSGIDRFKNNSKDKD